MDNIKGYANSRTIKVSEANIVSANGDAITGLAQFVDLIVTWDATALDRANADETYDLYITTGDGISEWDIIHFPQIATAGAKRFTAIVSGRAYPQNVTTAAPGTLAVTSGTLATVTGGANVIKSLGAGIVRHGPWGDRINWYLVIAGTSPTITSSIVITLI